MGSTFITHRLHQKHIAKKKGASDFTIERYKKDLILKLLKLG